MISIDWQHVIGALLVGTSGIGGLAWGGKTLWAKWKSLPPGTTAVPPGRSADDGPPPGAVDWAKDLQASMGKASPESILFAIVTGYSRAEALKMRISELENKS
jgi:hypothetical protein